MLCLIHTDSNQGWKQGKENINGVFVSTCVCSTEFNAHCLTIDLIIYCLALKAVSSKINHLNHRCPTLSSFATCGERRFKCGKQGQLFINGFLLIISLFFPHKSGDITYFSPQI
jgi:hypothetical protein